MDENGTMLEMENGVEVKRVRMFSLTCWKDGEMG
jgi:hypothetical protein